MKGRRSTSGWAALLLVVLSALSCSPLLPMSEDQYTLTRNGGVAAPVLSPPAGTYMTEQTVTITTATAGAAIRYTTDGSVPTSTTGTVYAGTLSVTKSQTIRAIACKEGFADSGVPSATYTLRAVGPVFNPGPGDYADGQDVAISTTTSGATIRYTTDGSTPTSTYGTACVGPVAMGMGTLKAIACRPGWSDSAVSSAIYGLVFTLPLYVAGGQSSAPCYWKNAIQTPLSWSGIGNSSACAVVLNGGSVYVAGNDYQTPCYWKDGTRVSLPMGGGAWGEASSVFIDSHGNRHLAGTISSGSLVAAYWYNENLTMLSGTFANGVTLDSAGAVYVVGCFNMSSSTPCYWKNGARTSLPMGTGDTIGTGRGVAIDATGNAIISGDSGTTSASAPCYWTSGVRNPLPMGSYADGIATGIALDATGNIYVVGGIGPSFNSHIPCYWKNGVLSLLSLGTGNVYGSANGITLDSSGNVYICGIEGPTSSSFIPCYWRNGVHTPLSTMPSQANGIAVGP